MTDVTFVNRANSTADPSDFESLVAALNNATQCDAVDPKRARRWILDPNNPLQILRFLNYTSNDTGFTASITAVVRPRGHFLVRTYKKDKSKFLAVVNGFYLDTHRNEIGFHVPKHSRPAWCIELRPGARPGRSVPSVLARTVLQDVESLSQRCDFDILHVSHRDFFVLRGSTRLRDLPSAVRTFFPSLQTPNGFLGTEGLKLQEQTRPRWTHDSATSDTGVNYHSQHVYRFVTVLVPLSKKLFVSFPLAGITVHLAPREVLVFTNIDTAGKAIPQASHSIRSQEAYLKWHIYRH